MKKLTLVSFMCRRKIVTAFVMAKVINNKTIISESAINKLLSKYWNFTPIRGETVSHM